MNRRALSLMETIIAMIILAMIMAGMANVFVAGKRHILHSRSRMAGGELGKHFLDYLQMHVRQDTWDDQTLNGLSLGTDRTCAQQPGCAAESTPTPGGITYTPTYNVTNVSGTALRRVRVDIQWQEPPP